MSEGREKALFGGVQVLLLLEWGAVDTSGQAFGGIVQARQW